MLEKPLRILLIEDNPGDALLIRTTLEENDAAHFQIVEARKLEDAIKKLEEREYDAALLDLSLPDSSGQETFHRFRAHATKIPVIVLTGLLDEELALELLHKGAQDYLVKGQVDAKSITRSLRYAIERNKVEQALFEAREEALRASKAKGEFLASLSHEIRTPMNSVLGMTDLLLESSLNSEQTHYVKVCKRAGEGLLHLINGVLDLSKVEAGKLELEKVPFRLEEMMDAAVQMVSYPAQKKDLSLAVRVLPQVPAKIVGDPNRLNQVLVNLLGNAIKFTQAGGVTLRAEKQKQEGNNLTLLFSVTDTGIGIPEKSREKIFESFAQADASTTRKYGGTGLGLTVSKKLIELMQGKIWCESQVGKGTTFFFTGVFQTAPGAEQEEPAFKLDLKGMRVLISPANRMEGTNLKEVLEDWKASVSLVNNGDQALLALEKAKAENNPYSLTLLDCRAPGKGGFQIVETLKQDPASLGGCFMMLPANHREGDIDLCKTLGLGACFVKPVTPSALAEAVRKYLKLQSEPVSSLTSQATPASKESSRALRILLAEDSEDNRYLVLSYLKNTPHQIDIAENGQIAFEKFQAKPYELVLMDMRMPVMTGYESVTAIRAWEKGKGLKPAPIFALTAQALPQDRENCLQVGCNEYITKPLRKQELLETIERYAKKQAQTETKSAEKKVESKKGEKKILAVDDDQDLLDLLKARLSSSGYKVVTCSDGKSGVETAAREQPDLIFLDLVIPPEGGLSILDNLRKVPALAQVPVVVLSGRDESEVKDEVIQHGGSRFLQKPFSKSAILDTVQELLQK